MPTRLLAAVALILAALAVAVQALGQTPTVRSQSVDVTPRPLVAEVRYGASVTFADGDPVVTAPGDASARRAALYLVDLARRSRDLKFRLASTRRQDPIAIELVRGGGAGAEGYTLDVSQNGARITAASDAGLFYGAVSLWQLLTPDPGAGQVTLQPMHIVDAPRFAYRGLLLDSARHFQSPAFVERMIDWMALHKLNLLQWHLTDDQGWRIQIRKYPRLTSVGAWRAPHDPATGEPRRYGGFYTQAQIRRIVAYAAARHVTIAPEIDMPGHALSAILAYPRLGTTKADAKTQSDWGIFPDILNPSDHTYAFMTDVLTEVMALFPGPWINVGGDEAVKDQWKASPVVQAQMKRLGIASEDALQGWFTARIGKFITDHHRRMIGWDDIMVGGDALPADAATVSWHLDGALKAVGAGHDTVIATAPTLYFDNRQADLLSEPTGRGAIVSLAEVYAVDPAPATMAPAARAHIIGVQANLWTEHMRTDQDVARMAFPRAAALAEVAWSAPERKDWMDFEARLPAELTRYGRFGLDPDTGAVGVRVAEQTVGGAETVTLSTQLGLGKITYTLDGGVPDGGSPVYQSPIQITARTRLRAAAWFGDAGGGPELDRVVDPAGPQRRQSQELTLCTSKVALNLDGQNAAQRRQPYLVDVMNPCWIWPQADLTRLGALRVAVTRLPFNFQIGADVAKIVLHPPSTPSGELEVRADGCAGEPIARLSLAPALSSNGVSVISGKLPPLAGPHDLCLSFTATKLDPMWVLAWVELAPAR
ncbi:MAG TPA: family 20 glycosylhydrolase [Caulobacteraceae bacterium]|nr:family 20 glycosylhydrolase [Caulobacteraceae bacterium]